MHGQGLLAVTGAQAIRTSIASADDDYALSSCQNFTGRVERISMAALIGLRQKLHGEMDSLELTSRNFQIPGLLRAARQHNGVEVSAQILDGNVVADLGAGYKFHAFRTHLLEPAIDDVLFHLELRDSVAQEPANAVCLFVHRNRMSGAAKLLSGSQSGRA